MIGTDYPHVPNVDPWAPPDDDAPRTWRAVDLSDVLAGTWEPPQATVGARSDGVGLFYPGKAHTVAGESESLKTWFALAGAMVEVERGHHVAYIDFEDDAGPVVGRLLSMGGNVGRLRSHFHYIRPEAPLTEGRGITDLAELMGDVRPTLAVVDGVTEGMTLHGLNPLDNKDCATFGRMLPRRLTRAGAAAVSLDHLTKSTEGRGRYALGAVHKLNALDGAAFVLEGRKAAGVGLVGSSTVRIAKDRPGQLRKHALPSSGLHWFADVVLDATGAGVVLVSVAAPETKTGTSTFRPTVLMTKISAALAEHGPLSQRKILTLVGGNRGKAIEALTFLTIDGYVTDSTPHQLIKPYADEGAK